MRNGLLVLAALAVAVLAWAVLNRDAEEAAEAPEPGAAMVSITLPDNLDKTARIGRRAFEANCASCHGENAVGRAGMGPPLVHKIYEPSHHGDESFQLAVANGVRAHHWRFGNMPAVEGLTRADVAAITAYIRALQRANGIE